MSVTVPDDIFERFEFYNYNHAAEIITQAYPEEWADILDALRAFTITTDELRDPGGNESAIPIKFDDVLYPRGWREIRISGDLHINFYPRRGNTRGRFETQPSESAVIEGYVDGHNIDFLKTGVAFDLEWNSKDQTYDRDVFAMRTYYECGIISAGIIVTRAEDLNDVFRSVYAYSPRLSEYYRILQKYGASTTHIDKLLYRLDSRRQGGCPILAIAIKNTNVIDWSPDYIDPNDPNY